MTEELIGREDGARGRGLAPLSTDLRAEERAFAEHLRALRKRADKTSAELAAELCVDATRLSRYLSGQSLPEPQLLTRFHQLLADDGSDSEEAARESRTLLYAAARSKGPLSARTYEIAELQEKMREQEAETARSLTVLQEDLRDERDRRHRVEQELERLRQAAPSDEDVRKLEAERDQALGRAAELEDQIAQLTALLRLQQDDARHAQEMADETAGELRRWEGPDSMTGQEQDDGMLRLRDGSALPGEDVIRLLTELRDEDRDEEADGGLLDIAAKATPASFGRLYRTLIEHGRKLDAGRLLEGAALHCDGLRLRQLIVDTSVSREKTIPDVLSGGVQTHTYEDDECGKYLAITVAYWTPAPEFARLLRALEERGETDLRLKLLRTASGRTRRRKRELREAGVRPRGPIYSWWRPAG